ncbi:MAG: tRNA (adenosine(37)-N6)-dimethylallyltransferase MiaA [Anaerolineae bacterium]
MASGQQPNYTLNTLNTHNLIFIIGPTAAGKSARAMQLAAHQPCEIVSADSRHVYRMMDIGTNKPTPQEQTAVPHHLLNLRDPHESFSLAEYLALARAAIDDVQARGKTALVVGGTGQYIRALMEGWQAPEVPPDEALRGQLAALPAEELIRQLASRDPAALNTIDPRNLRRVIRALEVMERTGQKWSELQKREPLSLRVEQIEYIRGFTPSPTHPGERGERDALYARADARILQMIEQGWLEETRRILAFLSERGILADAAPSLPAMSALGYRQMCAVLAGRMTMDETIAEIKHDTRRFIRMQDTWFRQMSAG